MRKRRIAVGQQYPDQSRHLHQVLAQLHPEQMLVWLELWLAHLPREKLKLATVMMSLIKMTGK
jgi:hypothetical protein